MRDALDLLSKRPVNQRSLVATFPELAYHTSVSSFFLSQEAGGGGEASPSRLRMVSAEVSRFRRGRNGGEDDELRW